MEDLNEQRRYYRIIDHNKENWGEIRFNNFKELIRQINFFNEKGYGIFKSINKFDKARKIGQCSKILAWGIDLDDNSKDEQVKKIEEVGLTPSEVIESKAGYHVYWHTRGDATEKNYTFLMKKIIVPIFKADVKCKDVTRVLRLENTKHWKDPKNPYNVKRVFKENNTYSEKFMLDFFREKAKVYGINLEEKKPRKRDVTLKSRDAREISEALNGIKRGEGEYQACCPAHPDKNPSFSISQRGENVLLYCHSKCSQDEVIEALRKLNLWS